ncbi:hypothetical protein M758_4G099800 [Ceratodon purpureus]|nr:hypothetical protein M758_4G099800 [Ceratodon purpureus]
MLTSLSNLGATYIETHRSAIKYSMPREKLGERGVNLFSGGLGEATLEVLHEGVHEWITGIQEEHLLSSDDRFDVIQVHHNGVLAAKDCGWVGQHRVQQADVARWKVRSPHDDLLPDL